MFALAQERPLKCRRNERSGWPESADKHIEVIVRQMLRRVRIKEVGDTNFLVDEQVEKYIFERERPVQTSAEPRTQADQSRATGAGYKSIVPAGTKQVLLLDMGRPRLFDLDGAVASALKVFWKLGYGATTPAELLAAIGVGKGSFYNAFGSKHALFEQALRRYGDDRVAGLSRWLADSGPVSQRINGYFEQLAAPENEATLRRGCFAANTAAELGRSDPAAMKIVRSTFERMEGALEAALREGQESDELDDDTVDPKAVASLLLATLVGITVLARVDGSSLRTKRIALAVAALQNSVRARNARS